MNVEDTIPAELISAALATQGASEFSAFHAWLVRDSRSWIQVLRYYSCGDHEGRSWLSWLVGNGLISVGDALAVGWDVHTNRDWALRLACSRNQLQTVTDLIAADADIHVNMGAPLWLAAYNGHLEIMRLLVAAGANISQQREEILRVATQNGNAEVVSYVNSLVASA